MNRVFQTEKSDAGTLVDGRSLSIYLISLFHHFLYDPENRSMYLSFLDQDIRDYLKRIEVIDDTGDEYIRVNASSIYNKLVEEFYESAESSSFKVEDIIFDVDTIRIFYENIQVRKFLKDLIIRADELLRSSKVLSSVDVANVIQSIPAGVFYEEFNREVVISLPEILKNTGFFVPGGMEKGRVHVYTAPPKTGKSMFAINLGYHLAKIGYEVIYVSLENTVEETVIRLFEKITGSTKQDIMGLPEYAIKELQRSIPETFHIKRLSPSLQSVMSLAKSDTIFIVDYINLLYRGKDSYTGLGNIVSSFVEIARKYKMSVILLSQSNRSGDVAESYKIVMNADLSAFLNRYGRVFFIDNEKPRYFEESFIVYDFDGVNIDMDNPVIIKGAPYSVIKTLPSYIIPEFILRIKEREMYNESDIIDAVNFVREGKSIKEIYRRLKEI